NLGAGNNSFNAMFDANNFRIADGAGGTTGWAPRFNVQGGRGQDSISVSRTPPGPPPRPEGFLRPQTPGGSGKDTIRTDFGEAGFTDGGPGVPATSRAFRMRIVGGSGDEMTSVNLANAPTATFGWDVAILGGDGENDITFAGTNPGGTPTFGPAGSVFIDGKGGRVDESGNFPVDVVNPNG